ncbi:MAG: hypothetical protein M1829_003980 [Trizodia sp. TS-e1964]|nr:MAG: hypothetical protein M1829_003980 [Trizodia sp. TS-e1964]
MRGIISGPTLGLAALLISHCSGIDLVMKSGIAECPTFQAPESAKIDSSVLIGRFPNMDTAGCGQKCNENPACESFVSDSLKEGGKITCLLFNARHTSIFEDGKTAVTPFGTGQGDNVARTNSGSDVAAAIKPMKVSKQGLVAKASEMPSRLKAIMMSKVPEAVMKSRSLDSFPARLHKRRPFLWWPDKEEKPVAERTIVVFPMVSDFCSNAVTKKGASKFQNRRNKNRASSPLNPPMNSFFQFITTPTADTPGTLLLLHFDDKRYLIGQIAEGSQRASTTSGARLVKASSIFLTGKTQWAYHGGLMGLLLTLSDVMKASLQQSTNSAPKKKKNRWNGKELKPEELNIAVHGGENLLYTIATARKFIFRTGFPLSLNEWDEEGIAQKNWEPTWSDENIRVWTMSIAQSATHGESDVGSKEHPRGSKAELKTAVTAMFGSNWSPSDLVETKLSEIGDSPAVIRNPETGVLETLLKLPVAWIEKYPDLTGLVKKPWPGAGITSLPETQPSKNAISYIFKSYPNRGRFDAKKAAALGVSGPDRSKLTRGENVIGPDGTVFTPAMFLGETRNARGVAVIDLPSIDYIDSLVQREEWKAEDLMDGVGVIIWILGPGVSNDPRLRDFVQQREHIKHVVSSVDHCPNYLAFESAATAAIRLHQIDPNRFPIPVHDNIKVPQFENQQETHNPPISQFLPAQRGLKVVLGPNLGIDDQKVQPFLNTRVVWDDTPKEVLLLAEEGRRKLAQAGEEKELQKGLFGKDAEIITLGTGSAMPSKYRNVSSTLLRVPGQGSYLFDCGENTLGQLKRIYQPDELLEVLKDLKAIWISHMHADHHLGTVSMIRAWYHAMNDPTSRSQTKSWTSKGEVLLSLDKHPRLFVLSEPTMAKWLEEYSAVEDFGYNKIIPWSVFSNKGQTHFKWGKWIVAKSKEPSKELNLINSALGISSLEVAYVTHCKHSQAISITFPNCFKISYSGDCRPSRQFSRIGENSTVLLHEATFDNEMTDDAKAKKHSTTSDALTVAGAMQAQRVVLTHFSQRYPKIPIIEEANSNDEVSDFSDDSMGLSSAEEDLPPDKSSLISVEPPYLQNKALTEERTPLTAGPAKPIFDSINGASEKIMADGSADCSRLSSATKITPIKPITDPIVVSLDEPMPDSIAPVEAPSQGPPESGLTPVINAPPNSSVAINPPFDPIPLSIDAFFTQTADLRRGNPKSPPIKYSIPPTKPTSNRIDSIKQVRREEFQRRIEARQKRKAHLKEMRVIVAFDLMRVKVGEIAQLEYFKPALLELYKDENIKAEALDADPLPGIKHSAAASQYDSSAPTSLADSDIKSPRPKRARLA